MTEKATRKPAVAGLFYPSGADTLRHELAGHLAEAEGRPQLKGAPKAIIAPHAGYDFSGPTAGVVYGALRPFSSRYTRVILLGPAHRVPVAGLAAPTVAEFTTPLGSVPIDTEALAALRAFPQVQFSDLPHAQEHSLEVQLPFLQTVLNNFSLVPLVVGDASAGQVGEVLDALWGGEETLIVISSDLSHYLDYESAKAADKQTLSNILEMRPEKLQWESACGRGPIRGLLTTAAKRGMRLELLDARNSGDTAGPKNRVVGYAAVAAYE